MRVLIAGLMLFCLVFASYAEESIRGKDIVVIGGSTGDGNNPPTIDIGDNINPSNLFRDPSQYLPPAFPKIKPTPPSPQTSNEFSTTSTPLMIFGLKNSFSGEGYFGRWKCLDFGLNFTAKKTSSAIYGLSESSEEISYAGQEFSDDFESVSTAALGLREKLNFSGTGYTEILSFRNRNDSINQYYESGAISKNDLIVGFYDHEIKSDDIYYDNNNNFTQFTRYEVDTNFDGISRLDVELHDQNPTKIEEDYIGKMSLYISLWSNITLNKTLDLHAREPAML